jgi:hypothetical protein
VAAGFPIVRDRSRFFSAKPFADCLEHAILLRRDRYVAAVEPLDTIADLLPIIARLTPARRAPPKTDEGCEPPNRSPEVALSAEGRGRSAFP